MNEPNFLSFKVNFNIFTISEIYNLNKIIHAFLFYRFF